MVLPSQFITLQTDFKRSHDTSHGDDCTSEEAPKKKKKSGVHDGERHVIIFLIIVYKCVFRY